MNPRSLFVLLSLLVLTPLSLSLPKDEKSEESLTAYFKEASNEEEDSKDSRFISFDNEASEAVKERIRDKRFSSWDYKDDEYYDDEYTSNDISNSIDSSYMWHKPINARCGKKEVRTTEGFMRILGGQKAQRGSWPWQVVILDRKKRQLCGGTLIDPKWILTAAHCVESLLYVRLGEHDLKAKENSEVEVKVQNSFSHTDYDSDTYRDDIALLKLPTAVKYTKYIVPACLPVPSDPAPISSKCYITGWGHINGDGDDTDLLRAVRIPIVSLSECQGKYPVPVTKKQICAGFASGSADACAGDSGGPLVCERNGIWTIHGITSFGQPCGALTTYGVYTKVLSYLDWIKQTMAKK